MARLPFPSVALSVSVFLGLAASLPAQSTSPAPATPVTSDPASTATPPAPKRPRAISSDVAALLSQSMPKYVPPPPAPPPPTPAEIAQKKADEEAAAAADLRELDKPKNGIVRLPKYVVQEQRPAVLTEKDVNTKKGMRDLAMRRYISDADRALNRFSLPLFAAWSPGSDKGSATEQRALLMYAEDERLRNMSDLADNANMVMKSNASDGANVKREVQKTYMRTDDYGYGGMRPK